MQPFKGFFFLWLILELIVFFLVAEWLGVLNAVLLVIIPIVYGGGIVRMQGMKVLSQAQTKVMNNNTTEIEMFEAAAIVFAGVLFFIPGIITSCLAILLLIPGLRRVLLVWMLKKSTVNLAIRSSINARVIDADQWHEEDNNNK